MCIQVACILIPHGSQEGGGAHLVVPAPARLPGQVHHRVPERAAGVADAGFTLYNNDPLLAGLAVGSKGAISYTTIFPLARQMQQAYAKGNFAGAQQAQLSILAYDAIIGQFGGKPAARSLPGLFDARIKIGPPRSPLKVISDDDLAGLKAALQSAGFLPKSEL